MKKTVLFIALAMSLIVCPARAQEQQANDSTAVLAKKECRQARHIILWTLKSELSREEKQRIIESTKADLLELKKKVPGVIKLDIVYDGRLESSNCDFMFDFLFESTDALNTFNTHPEHLKAAGKLKPYIQGRACLDVEQTH